MAEGVGARRGHVSGLRRDGEKESRGLGSPSQRRKDTIEPCSCAAAGSSSLLPPSSSGPGQRGCCRRSSHSNCFHLLPFQSASFSLSIPPPLSLLFFLYISRFLLSRPAHPAYPPIAAKARNVKTCERGKEIKRESGERARMVDT